MCRLTDLTGGAYVPCHGYLGRITHSCFSVNSILPRGHSHPLSDTQLHWIKYQPETAALFLDVGRLGSKPVSLAPDWARPI